MALLNVVSSISCAENQIIIDCTYELNLRNSLCSGCRIGYSQVVWAMFFCPPTYSVFNLNELLTYVVIIAGVQALPALAGKACTPAMLLF
jgi:hypothetical protein